MSVRSHYSETSYMNRRIGATSARMGRVMCRNCEYRLSAGQEPEQYPVKMPDKPMTPIQQERWKRVHQQKPASPTPEKEKDGNVKKGVFQRFGEYIAKNQAAMKAAGETSIMEDLSDAGKKMFSQAGQLGEEEIARINKKSENQQRESDDEIIDYMIGKGRGRGK